VNDHRLFIEGGGDSKAMRRRCGRAFGKLLEKAGFVNCLPRLVACGSRNEVFDKFKTAHAQATDDQFIAMLIDSEDPAPVPADTLMQKTWDHLWVRDSWPRPEGTTDLQVLFMTTCMEAWIAADRYTLRRHYGHKLIESRLPSTDGLERQNRRELMEMLVRATEQCTNTYEKGNRSFDLLAKLRPEALKDLLPSFQRNMAILGHKLEALPIAVIITDDRPEMTLANAALIALMQHHLADPLHTSISISEIHKLLYFLQEAQEPLGLRYVTAPSGPYAENLQDLLQAIDGHFIGGYDSGNTNPGALLYVLEGAEQQATQFLANHSDTQARCQRVCDLISGFISGSGRDFCLDLLASIHWLQKREQPRSMQKLLQISQSWNPPMQRFTADEIQRASTVLAEQGWVQPLT
jgi:hypothetical protein